MKLRLTFSMQVKPYSLRSGRRGVITFLRSEVTVFPHIAKAHSSKEPEAQMTNPRDMESVLPLLTAPSQMIACKAGYFQFAEGVCLSAEGFVG